MKKFHQFSFSKRFAMGKKSNTQSSHLSSLTISFSILSPVSQLSPEYPDWQSQRWPPRRLVQVAPFLHGLFVHSFTSVNKIILQKSTSELPIWNVLSHEQQGDRMILQTANESNLQTVQCLKWKKETWRQPVQWFYYRFRSHCQNIPIDIYSYNFP